jgi:hypothetical protein
MFAIVGIHGSTHHDWCRVKTRTEGEEWASARSQEIRDQHPAVGSLPVRVLTDREASKIRWQDGHRVYGLSR